MKALYRRYRPRKLDQVIGQDQVTKPLQNALKSGKTGHAYLFIGPRGTGKTSVARILAHELNGFDYELEDEYLDIIEIDAASNTGVDNIRDIREKAMIAPTKGKFKIYIIDEVHMLTKQAFNALLKTLEEPPAHVIFIMATTDADKVPVTISSRSQTLVFKLADFGTMFDYLKKVSAEEKIKIDDDALTIVVKRGGGSYRDTLSLLDQVSTLSEDTITAELITKALGLPHDQMVQEILSAYASGDAARIRQDLIDLDRSNVKPEIIADSLIRQILEKPENIYLPLLDKLTEVPGDNYPNVRLLLALAKRENPVVAAPASTPIANPAPSAPAAPTAKPEPKAASTPAPAPVPAPAPTAAPQPKPAEAAAPAATPAPAAEPVNEPTPFDDEIPLPDENPFDNIPSGEPIQDLGAPAPAAMPAPTPAPEQSEPVAPAIKAQSASNFNLDQFKQQVIQNIINKAPVAQTLISGSSFEQKGSQIIIHANNKFAQNQLMKKMQIIAEVAPSEFQIEIKPDTFQADSQLADIAALMGGGEAVNINI